MNRREGYEAYWAAQHGVPVESLDQYRCDDERQYTIPKMASRYRVWCAALDSVVVELPDEREVLPQINGDLVRTLHSFGSEQWNECLGGCRKSIAVAGLKVTQ